MMRHASSLIFREQTVSSLNKREISRWGTDSAVKVFDGAVKDFDGAIKDCYEAVNLFDGTVALFDEAVALFDGAVAVFDGTIRVFDRPVAVFDRAVALFDGAVGVIDGAVAVFDGVEAKGVEKMPKGKSLDEVIAAAERIMRVWDANDDFKLGEITKVSFKASLDELLTLRGQTEETRRQLTNLVNTTNDKAGSVSDM